MNTIINISDLPESVKKCYFKWSELTGIDNLNCFFEDFGINTLYVYNRKYVRVFENVPKTYCLEYLFDNKLCKFIIWDNKEVYGCMEDFIEQIDKLYESIRN